MRLADIYKKLLLKCYVSIDNRVMTKEKFLLRDRLEEEYNTELERQFEVWIKADTCLFHKEVDELNSKR